MNDIHGPLANVSAGVDEPLERLPQPFERRLLPAYVSAREIDPAWESLTGQAGYFIAAARESAGCGPSMPIAANVATRGTSGRRDDA